VARRLPPPPPSREEVERKLQDLIAERITREDASAWASLWVTADNHGIEDDAVWDAVSALWGADGPANDRPYLFGPDDFGAWLAEFREKTRAQ
jgi:protein-disulfide isomerase